MTKGEILDLSTLLQSFYPRQGLLSDGMLRLWHETLTRFDLALVLRAVKRWARQHTIKAPSLDELLEQLEYLQDEDRRSRLPASSAGSLAGLRQAVATAPPRTHADALFARAMLLLTEHLTGHRPRISRAQCAQWCQQWAYQYQDRQPDLAQWLQQAATQYAAMADPVRPDRPWSSVIMPLLDADLDTTPTLPAWEEPCIHEHVTDDETACRDCGLDLTPQVA